jgi:hypothetical protein
VLVFASPNGCTPQNECGSTSGVEALAKYVLHGRTRRDVEGWFATVVSLPVAHAEKPRRLERLLKTESEAMLMLVMLAGALSKEIEKRGHEVPACISVARPRRASLGLTARACALERAG